VVKTYSNGKFRLMIGAHLVWLAMVCLLGAWWGRLVLQQAHRIAELESQLGVSADLAQSYWHKTQRMLFWESGTFFALLSACSGLLLFIYWRDVQRSRSVSAFFASVTHELRTPLCSIRLHAESLANELPGHKLNNTLIRRLLEDTFRLEGQVERTLELARVEGGGPVFNQPLPLKSWVERFIQQWKTDHPTDYLAEHLADQPANDLTDCIGKVEIVSEIDDLVVNADPMALQVIFRNLFENSVKHSNFSSNLSGDTSGKRLVKVNISAEREGSWVWIRFKDDGRGFNGDLKKLGSLFQKGATSSGTGVGLYLSKMLMKRMGGEIYFHNELGFQVLLKLSEGGSYVESNMR